MSEPILDVTITGTLNLEVLLEELDDAVRSGFTEKTPIFAYAFGEDLVTVETGIAPGAENSEKRKYTIFHKQFSGFSYAVEKAIQEAISARLRYFSNINISMVYIETKEPEKPECLDPEDQGEDPGMFPHLDPTPEIPDFEDSGIAIEEPSDLSLGDDDLLTLGGDDSEDDGSAVVLQPDGLPSPEDLEKAAMQNLLARPISDLALSVRARKCMIRLAISTIGELVAKTSDELLECKQFGVTTLNEIREKLIGKKLKLKGD